MITLKLGAYSRKELKTMAILLENASIQIRQLSPNCNINCCNTCQLRHLCIDLLKAHTYAKDYIVKK